jgi:uncharacterized RDD family membrane protein YckC
MEASLHCTNHWDVVEGLRRCSRCNQTYCGDCLVDIRGLPYCAQCKNEQILDVRSGVSSTSLDLASRGSRFVAFLIDGLLIGIPFGIFFFVIGFRTILRAPGMWVTNRPLSLLPLVVMFIYEGLMLSARGQTVGKIALNIKVVQADGSDITAGQAWGRAIMREVLLSCLMVFNYVPAFFTRERTCLHDMVAATRVVNWG